MNSDPGARPLAVVTGGAGGIGAAFCRRLAALGYGVLVADASGEAAELLAASLRLSRADATALRFDVADAAAWDTLAGSLAASGRPVALLVNSAGVLVTGSLADCTAEDLERIVAVNLLGTMLGCRALTPLLAQAADQSVPLGAPLPVGIVNLASVFALASPPGFAPYSATKAGVAALSEALAGELRPLGVRVTAALPGVVPTGLFERATHRDEALRRATRARARSAELTPEGVANRSLAALRRGEPLVVIGGRARRFALVRRLFPSWARGVVQRQSRSTLGREAH